MQADALFDLTSEGAVAQEVTPKCMRELLFAGLLLSLEDAIEREHPAFDEQEYMLNADGSKRSGTPYWQAHHRASGMQSVVYLVRNALATHEEYLVADRERIKASWSEREMECARHRDVCPRCTEASQRAWTVGRTVARAERIADSYLDGILGIQLAIAQAAENGHSLTAAQIEKSLDKVIKTAARLRAALPEETTTDAT